MAAKPPFSEARRAMLGSEELPDYEHQTVFELRREMRRRGIELRNRTRKAHFVVTLRQNDEKDLERYKSWKADEETCQKTAGHYEKEETGRTGFMDLTGEIRNMIYSYALFDPRPGGRVMCKSDVLYDAESDCLRTIVFGDCRTHSRNTELTARVNMLCAMSKQVCHEVRGVFWSGFRHLLNPYDSDMSSFEVTHRYLRKIGSEGKAGVTELPLVLGHRHLGYEGRTAFRGLGQLLHPCLNLQRFTLSIGVTHILWNDREQLQDYLLHGKPLVSPGFDEFVRILRSLQRLRQVTIKMIPSFQASYRLWQEEPDKFLQFACSGIREFSLYLFMYERLNANHTRLHKGTPRKFGDAIVWLDFPPYLDNDGGSEIQDFKGWLQWREKTARETRRYIEQMDPDTDDDG